MLRQPGAPQGLPAAPSASGSRLPAQGCASWVSGAMGTPSPWRRGWGRSGRQPRAGTPGHRNSLAPAAQSSGRRAGLSLTAPDHLHPAPPPAGARPGTARHRPPPPPSASGAAPRAARERAREPGPPPFPTGAEPSGPPRPVRPRARRRQLRTAPAAAWLALWAGRRTRAAAAGLPGGRKSYTSRGSVVKCHGCGPRPQSQEYETSSSQEEGVGLCLGDTGRTVENC